MLIRRERKLNRLKGYDYSQDGFYFVTICVQDRKCFFGDVKNGQMELSIVGKEAEKCWLEIPNHFPDAKLDEFVVMPNHLHGIIVIKCSINYQQTVNCRGVQLNAPTSKPDNYYSRISPQKNTLSVIIRTYKAAVTRWCRNNGFEYFKWQRNYHDHIIRSEKELNAIRQYITDNPLNWQLDSENPHSEN